MMREHSNLASLWHRGLTYASSSWKVNRELGNVNVPIQLNQAPTMAWLGPGRQREALAQTKSNQWHGIHVVSSVIESFAFSRFAEDDKQFNAKHWHRRNKTSGMESLPSAASSNLSRFAEDDKQFNVKHWHRRNKTSGMEALSSAESSNSARFAEDDKQLSLGEGALFFAYSVLPSFIHFQQTSSPMSMRLINNFNVRFEVYLMNVRTDNYSFALQHCPIACANDVNLTN
jgi:hypothetical protein